MAQGKPYNKAEIVESLKRYFVLGYKIKRACKYAGFDDSLIYKWLKKDPSLAAQIQAWQGQINSKARENIAQAILGNASKKIKPSAKWAAWWLERMERDEFGDSIDVTSRGDRITNIQVEYIDNIPKNDTPNPSDQGTEADSAG